MIVYIMVFFLSVSAVHAQTYYVSPEGSDSNKGASSSPFKTLGKAKLAVRAALPSAGGVTVYLREGIYRLSSALEFDDSDAGTATVPVTWSAYNNEKVVISGAVELTPTWSTHSGNVLVANIGTGYSFDVLFANGSEQVMARYPNYQEDSILQGYDSDVMNRISGWSDPTTGFVRGLHNKEWGGNSYKITDANGSLEWVGDNNRGGRIHDEYQMVENIFEELDAPGEWFYDESDGKLYFYPPAILDATTANFEGASAEELIRVVGSSATKAGNLVFKNITFTQTHRTLFTRDYELLLRSDWGVARAAAIFLQDAENVTVKNSNFTNLGGNGVFISGYNRGHLITNNEFLEIGATCVNVVGLTSAVRYPSFWDDHKTDIQDVTPGPLTEDYPKDITITYNHMYNMGRYEKQTSGVNLSMSESITVGHNTIHKSPRAGINICDGTWGGHIIEFNDVFDCVRETSDHGPINSWGRDRFWSYQGYNTGGSLGTEKKPYAFLDAWKTTHIRNNRIHYDNPTRYGIDLDDGSSNYEIYNNLLLNTNIKLREGFGRKVYNNIEVNSRLDFHVWFDECEDQFFHNIVTGINNPYRFIGVDASSIEAKKFTADSNVFYNSGSNVNVGISNWTEVGLDLNSETADPLFVDPSNLDYSVASNSPALTLGFVNFPMDQFGKPGSPEPGDVINSGGQVIESDAEPLMGAMVASIYDMSIQSATGAGDTNGVYFEEVPAGSYAANQGFEQGDVILSILGVKITDKQSFWLIYQIINPGAIVPITVLKNQIEVPLSFVKMNTPEKHNNTAGVVYYGDWAIGENNQSFNGDIHSNQNSDDYFELKFNGTGVSFVSQKNSDMGEIKVYIDDVLQEIVDCFNADQIHQQTVFRITDLSDTLHTLKVVNAEGAIQTLDAFTVIPGGDNLAMNGVATQSSTNYDGVASLAIDGDSSSMFNDGSVTHTASELNPWWQVDLGDEYPIATVNIFGRTDPCCDQRLSDYTLYVLNNAGDTTYSENFTTFPAVSAYPNGASGRFVKIVLNDNNVLSLAEVQVFAFEETTVNVVEQTTGNLFSASAKISQVSNHQVMIQVSNSRPSRYSFLNTQGRQIASGMINGQKTLLDISGMQTGVYLIRVKNTVKKIIKQ